MDEIGARWFAYVRHAEYAKIAGGGRRNDGRPLTELGVTQARAAGDFLADVIRRHGLRVAEVVTTATQRTQQTADVILTRVDASPPARREASIGRGGDVADRMALWTADLRAGELLLIVGHGPSLSAVLDLVGLRTSALGSLHGAVAVGRRDGEGWSRMAFFPEK